MSERHEGPDPTPGFSPEAIDAAASVMYDRVKTVPTLTFAIAYPSEQEDFRRVARGMVAAYLSASGLLAALEASEREYKDLAEHHRQCELAGTRLAELVKREVTGEGNLPPVDDNVLMEAVEVWDAHQWPALTPSTPPDLREDAP